MEQRDILKTFKSSRFALPYVILLTNTFDGAAARNFVLFGFNRYQDVLNYGSDVGITYQVAGGSSTYAELLSQSTLKNFKIKYWQIITSDETNRNQSLLINYIDANGKRMIDPITLNAYKDAYQISPSMILLEYEAKVDGDFFITGQLQKSTSMRFVIYPDTIVNRLGYIYDEGDVKLSEQYKTPVLSKYIEYLKSKNK